MVPFHNSQVQFIDHHQLRKTHRQLRLAVPFIPSAMHDVNPFRVPRSHAFHCHPQSPTMMPNRQPHVDWSLSMVGGACNILQYKEKTIQPASLWLEVLNQVHKHKHTRKVVEDMTSVSTSPRAIVWSITPVHGGAMSKT
jgi:hypothetical protein